MIKGVAKMILKICFTVLNSLLEFYDYFLGITNAFGQPADENKVGLSFGLVKASNFFISEFESDQSKTPALFCSPTSHAFVSPLHAPLPNPKLSVGLDDTAHPLCKTHLNATSEGSFLCAFAISFTTGLDNSSSFGPGSPTAPYAKVRIPRDSPN